MPNIYTMMDIGRWALNTSTRQLDTISHNVANVNTEGYSRQEVVQSTRNPEWTPQGYFGRGVKVSNVIQNVDELLVRRISDKISNREYYDKHYTQLKRIETLANEAGETSIGKLITSFFNAWQDVANNPTSSAVREVLKEDANNLTNRLHTLMRDLSVIKRDMGTFLSDAVTEVNSICRRIAELNGEIAFGEAIGKPANDFKDERRRQINKLAELMNIQWFEDAQGAVTIQTGGGKTLVQSGYPSSRDSDPLEFKAMSGYEYNQVVWGNDLVLDSNEITGGKIGAWLKLRDSDIPGLESFFNGLAENLVWEVNKVHTQGVGLDKFTDVTGTYQSSSDTVAFNDSSNTLAFGDKIEDGTFDIWVYDSGTRRKYTINVYASDTLTTLKDRINLAMGTGGTPNLNPSVNPVASITSDHKLRLRTESGLEFAFANDTSNVLAALGINTFFDGHTATGITLNSSVENNVRYMAAGQLLDDGEHALGDNRNALALADLKDADTMSGSTETFNEAVISNAADLGTEVASDKDNYEFAEAATDELKNQRDATSAVNLDEEMVKMIRYQRGYQMAAKVISVADSLMAALLELKR